VKFGLDADETDETDSGSDLPEYLWEDSAHGLVRVGRGLTKDLGWVDPLLALEQEWLVVYTGNNNNNDNNKHNDNDNNKNWVDVMCQSKFNWDSGTCIFIRTSK